MQDFSISAGISAAKLLAFPFVSVSMRWPCRSRAATMMRKPKVLCVVLSVHSIVAHCSCFSYAGTV